MGETFDQARVPATRFAVKRELQPDGFFFLLPADGWWFVDDGDLIVHEPIPSPVYCPLTVASRTGAAMATEP